MPILKPKLSAYLNRYLLEDRFEFLLAAGSVNGSRSLSGANRAVVDTNGKISISGGVLDFATGAAANDAVWYESIARAAGRLLFGKVTLSETTNGIAVFGWDSAASGAVLDQLRFGASAALQIIANGGTAFAVGTYAATTYWICARMRGAGLRWYIKGGAFTNWTLLFQTALGSAAGFPAVQAGNTTAVFTAKDIVVPAGTNLDAPLLYDDFTR